MFLLPARLMGGRNGVKSRFGESVNGQAKKVKFKGRIESDWLESPSGELKGREPARKIIKFLASQTDRRRPDGIFNRSEPRESQWVFWLA